jgi:hypothetical protein
MMIAEHSVTFPITNRMYGMDRLAKHLNLLVSGGKIKDWHPGYWVDWDHAAIRIVFDSMEDAEVAKKLCIEDAPRLPSQEPIET